MRAEKGEFMRIRKGPTLRYAKDGAAENPITEGLGYTPTLVFLNSG
jgi:hypothetical protein